MLSHSSLKCQRYFRCKTLNEIFVGLPEDVVRVICLFDDDHFLFKRDIEKQAVLMMHKRWKKCVENNNAVFFLKMLEYCCTLENDDDDEFSSFFEKNNVRRLQHLNDLQKWYVVE